MTATEPGAAGAPLRVLLAPGEEAAQHGGRQRGGQLPAVLRERYGADLRVPLVSGRPTVIGNFVSTLDGVIAFDVNGLTGGGEVSGFFEPDRFVMALLRSLADAVVIGAGTFRADPRGRWVAESVHRESAALTSDWRASMHLARHPTTVIVTASGNIDLSQPGVSNPDVPVLLVTTSGGRHQLARHGSLPANVEVLEATSRADGVDARWLIDELGRRGWELILSEGGPHVMSDLVAAGLLDELFLTVAPQLAGRTSGNPRLALIEGHEFSVADAPWAQLIDVRSADDHLFTRYRFTGRERYQ